MPPDFAAIYAFDRSLEPAQIVQVRWTNCGRYYEARATVVRINGASVRVRLEEDVGDWSDESRVAYPLGREIRVPRVLAADWSYNNGVFPVGA